MMKKLIIDGHNLIPKIPGINLSQMDDETRLMEVLSEFARRTRVKMEVFFDGAPPAQAHQTKGGLIHVHFIRKSSSADEAITQFLRSHQNERDGMTLITSDNRILQEAKLLGFNMMRSEVFSNELTKILNSPFAQDEVSDRALNQAEIDEWMRLFSKK